MKRIKVSYERIDSRGIFREIINSGDWKSVNYGFMNKGAILGNHYHKECDALFFLIKGTAHIEILNIKEKGAKKISFDLTESEGVIFEPFETHIIKFSEDSTFLMLKSKIFDSKNPDLHEYKLD